MPSAPSSLTTARRLTASARSTPSRRRWARTPPAATSCCRVSVRRGRGWSPSTPTPARSRGRRRSGSTRTCRQESRTSAAPAAPARWSLQADWCSSARPTTAASARSIREPAGGSGPRSWRRPATPTRSPTRLQTGNSTWRSSPPISWRSSPCHDRAVKRCARPALSGCFPVEGSVYGRADLPGELRVQAHDARVHVRQRRLPPDDVWNVRRVVEERRVAVRQVVDVQPRGETLAREADDLLHAKIDRSGAVAVQRAAAVQRAGGDQVHVREWATGQRTADLLRDRSAERIGRGEGEVRRQRSGELVRAGVVRSPVEDGTIAIDA